MTDQVTALITTVAIPSPQFGMWYPRGAERLMMSSEFPVRIFRTLPPCAPRLGIYEGYGAKPFALRQACEEMIMWGVCSTSPPDIAILCDASFYQVRPLQPLIDHILKVGYYLCRNGSTIGEWTSDACLAHFGIDRDTALTMPDCSSYCVGIDTHNAAARELVEEWCRHSTAETICGYHTNGPLLSWGRHHRRNQGPVSKDARVKGHRQDQAVLGLCAHRLGLLDWCNRPLFTSYKGFSDESTVLECEGMREQP